MSNLQYFYSSLCNKDSTESWILWFEIEHGVDMSISLGVKAPTLVDDEIHFNVCLRFSICYKINYSKNTATVCKRLSLEYENTNSPIASLVSLPQSELLSSAVYYNIWDGTRAPPIYSGLSRKPFPQ